MMGFQRVEWVKEKRPFDIVAELQRQDPDGFIYRDIWIISTCRNPELLKEIETLEEILYEMLDFDRFRNSQISPPEDQFTILYIQTSDQSKEAIDHIRELIKEESRLLLPAQNKIRIRIWDQTQLTSLVSRHPNLCNKYFSEDYRSRSSHRKSFEEINLENVNLTIQLSVKNAELEKEKRLRVSAERDAIWKDLASVAAHKLGNPVFAIETFIDPIEKRISENNQAEAIAILSDFRASIDKAKDILDQFKHLTTAQNINLEPTQLLPLLDDSCRVAKAQGVEITIKCGENIIIQADPKRLAECFDELIKNSLSWMQDSPKKISIDVTGSTDSRSDANASSMKHLVIIFSDNGPGVLSGEKEKIFQAFHSNRPEGSGLGLAFVRRIIEGHGGSIQEIGQPGQGCVMRIKLPMFDDPSGKPLVHFEEPKSKPKSKRKKK
jgi:signal transduction histidine kinase